MTLFSALRRQHRGHCFDDRGSPGNLHSIARNGTPAEENFELAVRTAWANATLVALLTRLFYSISLVMLNI